MQTDALTTRAPRPASIMVVDDTRDNLNVLKSILSAEHYEVRPLPDGHQALRAARAEPPDLILLDIMMPGLDGYQVCTKLKDDPITRDVPVIFLSALQGVEDKTKAFAVGGVDYVSKPFQVDEVLARVATHLRLSGLQRALQQQNSELQQAAILFEVSNDGVMLTDSNGIIQRVNPALTALTGYSATELKGQTPRLLKSGRHDQAFYKQMWTQLHEQGLWEGEIWNRGKNGAVLSLWQRITALRDEHGATSGYLVQCSDLARLRGSDHERLHYNRYDPLTGLINRFQLMDRLGVALREHRRNSRKLCILMIGLDRFKHINESLGYSAGDHLLKQVATRLSEQLCETDTAARVGADEFVVLLTDQANYLMANRIALQLLDRLCQEYALPQATAELGASIGVSLFPDDGHSVDLLLRNANLAMTRAKQQGGRRVRYFTESMGQALLQKYQLETDLRRAIQRAELEVVYQPIVELDTGRICGVESLLRWQHPIHGNVSPAKFIPIAEDSGLIKEIGNWVITSVCQQLRAWQAQGLELYASVNLSPLQIPHGLPAAWLRDLIERMQLAPERLVLEITESVMAADLMAVAGWMHSVRDQGCRLYLDDFGTGYSSLSYLKNLPVNAVKIDQVFVRDMVNQSTDYALIKAVMTMSQSLGLEVVAEGIETLEQKRLLQAVRCRYGQGNLFSAPLSAAALQDFIKQQGLTCR